MVAPTTIALLGMPLSQKHDAFRNKKLMSEKVKENKLVAAPSGLQWQGIYFLQSSAHSNGSIGLIKVL